MTVLLGYAQKLKNFVFGAISFPEVFVLETTLFLDKKVTCVTFLGLNFFFVFSYLFVAGADQLLAFFQIENFRESIIETGNFCHR